MILQKLEAYVIRLRNTVQVLLRNINAVNTCIIFLFIHCSVLAHWTEPYNAYLFAPGLWSSEHQAAKYCKEYIASTGQKVVAKHGFELINGAFCTSCNFAEIALVRISDILHCAASYNPIFMGLHYLYELAHAVITTSNNRYKISIEGQSNNGLTLDPYILNLLQLNFGQKTDIELISARYDHCCTANPNRDIVLYGTSRGAASLIAFMALEYLKKPQKRVKALIFEGCYDSMENLTWLGYPLSYITKYTYKGIAPNNPAILKAFTWVCNFYNIPVLFVTSLKDQRVSAERTYSLCQDLKKTGLKELYCYTLENSTHSAYLKDSPEDAAKYEAIVHAFYHKFGLSHDPHLAQKGKVLLTLSKVA